METKDIILIILVILVIYLLYKTRNSENFSSGTLDANIITAVNNKYKIDMDAMRNLASISKNILTQSDKLTLPANMTEMKGDAFIERDLGVKGDLKVTGNVIFNNKNWNIMEIFPAGFIIAAWRQDNQLLGWAPCDGRWYKLNDNTKQAEVRDQATEGYSQTPDLRSRFIVGASGKEGEPIGGSISPWLKSHQFGWYGGQQDVTLTEAQMPSHSHDIINILNQGLNCEGNNCAVCPPGGLKGVLNSYSGEDRNYSGCARPNEIPVLTSYNGGGQAHNNLPPYVGIYYFIKL
jgi:microcystin-dependent protein